MLERYRYVDLIQSFNLKKTTIEITPKGFEFYAKHFDEAKHALFGLVADQIVNQKAYNSKKIAQSLSLSPLVIQLILEYYSDIGELQITRFMDGRIEVDKVGIGLKRAYQKTS